MYLRGSFLHKAFIDGIASQISLTPAVSNETLPSLTASRSNMISGSLSFGIVRIVKQNRHDVQHTSFLAPGIQDLNIGGKLLSNFHETIARLQKRRGVCSKIIREVGAHSRQGLCRTFLKSCGLPPEVLHVHPPK